MVTRELLRLVDGHAQIYVARARIAQQAYGAGCAAWAAADDADARAVSKMQTANGLPLGFRDN
jgi:hypothetical protein